MQIINSETSTELAKASEELFKNLLDTALSGRHTDFEFLKSFAELRVMQTTRRGLKKIIILFNSLADELYNTYCKEVLLGTNTLDMLYVMSQYRKCAQFYQEELHTAEEMVEEYWCFVRAGHWLDQFLFFKPRECWDMWDFRKRDIDGTK